MGRKGTNVVAHWFDQTQEPALRWPKVFVMPPGTGFGQRRQTGSPRKLMRPECNFGDTVHTSVLFDDWFTVWWAIDWSMDRRICGFVDLSIDWLMVDWLIDRWIDSSKILPVDAEVSWCRWSKVKPRRRYGPNYTQVVPNLSDMSWGVWNYRRLCWKEKIQRRRWVNDFFFQLTLILFFFCSVIWKQSFNRSIDFRLQATRDPDSGPKEWDSTTDDDAVIRARTVTPDWAGNEEEAAVTPPPIPVAVEVPEEAAGNVLEGRETLLPSWESDIFPRWKFFVFRNFFSVWFFWGARP